jgi:hypothetical protein
LCLCGCFFFGVGERVKEGPFVAWVDGGRVGRAMSVRWTDAAFFFCSAK